MLVTDCGRYGLVGVAGLMGAAGVALAASAAHLAGSSALATGATMMLIHCAAALALISLAGGVRSPGVWHMAALIMLLGAGLFGGDIALNTFFGLHLFPWAAPAGGILMIASWIGAAIAGISEMRNARR